MSESKIPERIIFHVDMDSFYASCELAKKTYPKDKPFIVGADPNKGKGRGVVLACNYPARKLGVRSGMPISRAYDLAPDANYVLPHHDLYRDVSRRVMDILGSFTERIEPVSIDEAYLDFTGEPSFAGSVGKKRTEIISQIAESIKKKIVEGEGITCSIGVSNTKITSKIATDMSKPDGLTIVKGAEAASFLASLPVERIPGIGKVTQEKLRDSFGIRTIADLSKIPVESLQGEFGRSGIWFHKVSLGLDDSEVVTKWDPVSQSSETTLDEDESNYDALSRLISDLASEVVKKVTNDGYLFRNVGIKIRFSGFETHTRSHVLAAPTDSLAIVQKECNRMLSEFAHSGRKVRLLGVRLSQLHKREKEDDQSTLLLWSQ